ncbi:MAG: hypothetical protein U0821_14540 [Chloroflexota bacterium]
MVDDLFARSRIDAASAQLGSAVGYVRSAAELEQALPDAGPVTLLVGMAATRQPWDDLIRLVRERRPDAFVLAFGPHMQTGLRARAVEAGADRVLANSAFVRAIPALLARPDAPVDESDS